MPPKVDATQSAIDVLNKPNYRQLFDAIMKKECDAALLCKDTPETFIVLGDIVVIGYHIRLSFVATLAASGPMTKLVSLVGL